MRTLEALTAEARSMLDPGPDLDATIEAIEALQDAGLNTSDVILGDGEVWIEVRTAPKDWCYLRCTGGRYIVNRCELPDSITFDGLQEAVKQIKEMVKWT